jgi:hypothetical protein
MRPAVLMSVMTLRTMLLAFDDMILGESSPILRIDLSLRHWCRDFC